MEAKILWADDEIDLLKPHIMFLKSKGYNVSTANNGHDAIEMVEKNDFDIIFLDENMPGISGLETLERIKTISPSIPVTMITKSEEESIMEEAIGQKIADYLIKPVNPNQILLSIKRNLDSKKLVSEKATSSYQQEFRQLSMRLGDRLDFEEWKELYDKLVYWELKLEDTNDEGMQEIMKMQKSEANKHFSEFVEDNYLQWLNSRDEDKPLMTQNVIKDRLAPLLENDPLYLVVIDNLRWDQWKMIRPVLREFFTVEQEEMFYSILPTATQYARNSLFAGLMPSEIEKRFPNLWLNDEDEGGKNMHEKEFLEANLKRLGKDCKFSYNKITNLNAGKKLVDNFAQLKNNDLNVIVYNFVDMLSHARTDMEVIRELADDESAYRSLTLSWFEHSPLFEIFKKIAETGGKTAVTTDHGTIHVKEPSKIVGDRNTNSNLRYKQGKNLDYDTRDVFEVKNPSDAFLPKQNVSSTFVFAKDDKFFVYPNNYNHFVKYFRGTFQHGGISLEEVLIPFAVLKAK